MEGLIDSLSPLPAHARRLITFYRDTALTTWQYLKDTLGVEPWFCYPTAPLQEKSVLVSHYLRVCYP